METVNGEIDWVNARDKTEFSICHHISTNSENLNKILTFINREKVLFETKRLSDSQVKLAYKSQ